MRVIRSRRSQHLARLQRYHFPQTSNQITEPTQALESIGKLALAPQLPSVSGSSQVRAHHGDVAPHVSLNCGQVGSSSAKSWNPFASSQRTNFGSANLAEQGLACTVIRDACVVSKRANTRFVGNMVRYAVENEYSRGCAAHGAGTRQSARQPPMPAATGC